MARQILVEILGDASKFTSATKQAQGGATNFGNVLQGIGQGVGIAAFANVANIASNVASSVVDFAKDSINAASDLNESMTLSKQVFEANADAVSDWADGAADAFGQSKREALDFASNFGNAFKNVGYSLDDATQSAMDMTRLAADLGSAFNKSSTEAATALRSGLLGESEPLRQFGVFLDEAKVKAKALAMGMKPVNGVFTDGQKVMARYQLIMEQTADSQGMFGRDSESLADTQKQLQATMENISAEIGQELLPVVVELAQVARDDLVPALRGAMQVARDWLPVLQTLAGPGGIVGMAKGFGQAADESESLTDRVKGLSDATVGQIPLIGSLISQVEDWGIGMIEAAGAADDLRGDVEGMAGSFDHGSSSANAAVSPTENLADAVGNVGDEAKSAATSMGTLKDTTKSWMDLIDERNEPAILRGHLADLKTDLKGVNDRIAVLEGKKYLTPAQKRELTSLRGEQSRIQGEIDKTRIKIGNLNGASLKEIKASFASMRRNQITPTKEQVQALNRALNNALRDRGFTWHLNIETGVKTFSGRASGGVASGLTWVGERGPELVDLPQGSYVYNNTRSMQMAQEHGTGTPVASKGNEVHIHIDRGAFIDGPSVDRLANAITQRLRYAPGT